MTTQTLGRRSSTASTFSKCLSQVADLRVTRVKNADHFYLNGNFVANADRFKHNLSPLNSEMNRDGSWNYAYSRLLTLLTYLLTIYR